MSNIGFPISEIFEIRDSLKEFSIQKRNRSFLCKPLMLAFVLILSISNLSIAQDKPQKVRFSGFLEYLSNTWIPQGELNSQLGLEEWQIQNGIYNRINFWYEPTKNLEFYVGMRNNFVFGPMITTYTDLFNLAGLSYSDLVTYDPGYLDLTFTIADSKS